MADPDSVIETILERQQVAELALHNGDATPRFATWSHHDPVTLFGAVVNATGWADVSREFASLAEHFTDGLSYEVEVVGSGVSGDLAYIAGYETTTVTIDGRPQTYRLRVTHVYRREDGEWRTVHRHGDRGAGTFEADFA